MIPIQSGGMRNERSFLSFQDSRIKLSNTRYWNVEVEGLTVRSVLQPDINIVARAKSRILHLRPVIVWANNAPVEIVEIGRILARGSMGHDLCPIHRTGLSEFARCAATVSPGKASMMGVK